MWALLKHKLKSSRPHGKLRWGSRAGLPNLYTKIILYYLCNQVITSCGSRDPFLPYFMISVMNCTKIVVLLFFCFLLTPIVQKNRSRTYTNLASERYLLSSVDFKGISVYYLLLWLNVTVGLGLRCKTAPGIVVLSYSRKERRLHRN